MRRLDWPGRAFGAFCARNEDGRRFLGIDPRTSKPFRATREESKSVDDSESWLAARVDC